MSYLFNTPDQRREMLRTIGAESIDELFQQVPADFRLARPLELPPALTEMELERDRADARRQKRGGRRSRLPNGGRRLRPLHSGRRR